MGEDNEEFKLLDTVLNKLEVLTCFNCGEKLVLQRRPNTPIGVLYVNEEEHNYPVSPDIPAEIYFECMECYNGEQRD